MNRLVQWWGSRRFSLVAAFYISLFSVLFGVLIAPAVTPQRLAHGDDSARPDHHQHVLLEHDSKPVPQVKLKIDEDALGGWNVLLILQDFTFAPHAVNEDNQFNTGHAHLYINGVKRSRLYAPTFYLPTLSQKENIITVTLNANDHSTWAVDGEAISASQTVSVD